MKLKQLVLSAIFTVLIIIGTYIKIPLPFIPITFQVLFVLLAGSLIKFPYAPLAPFTYMMLGLLGVPIFTKGGGFWYIFEKSFGYIIGFVIAAAIMSYLIKKLKRNILNLTLINIIGVFIIYFFGIIYFYMIQNFYIKVSMPIGLVLYYGLFLTIASDIIAIIISVYISYRFGNKVYD